MVRPPEHTELERALMRRVWALEEALMSIVYRNGFEYLCGKNGDTSVVNEKCTEELLDSLPWLEGK